MNIEYQQVKVHFPGNTGRTFTYLAPAHWDVRPGDHVHHRDMRGEGYAIVTRGSGTGSWTGSLKVLEAHYRPPAPEPKLHRVTVTDRGHVRVLVNPGTRVEVAVSTANVGSGRVRGVVDA